MSRTLTIKKVPDELVRRLRQRAAKNHRSVQGELMALIEDALIPRSLSLADFRREMPRVGLHTPSESTAMIREDRDAR